MTHSLYVLRHGKSDWGADYGGDHERPLKKRGRKAAARMGRFLSDKGEAPDRILSSSAVRARTTAELAAEAGGWDSSPEILTELYGAGARSILSLVQQIDQGVERLLVVGHEPTCSDLVASLTGGSVPHFPTAALARIDFDSTWEGVAFETGRLVWLITPRELE